VRRWIKQRDIDAGVKEGLTTETRDELCRLRRRKVRVLEEEREILKGHGLPPRRTGTP
jgi:hypothetical protein